MYSEKHDMFRIPGSGGHLIGSWDLHKHSKSPKLQRVFFLSFPELSKAKRDLLDSCYTSEYLVESKATGETFLIKRYRKMARVINGIPKMKTEILVVFIVPDDGFAFFTSDIEDDCVFLSKSEPFCVNASSFPGLLASCVQVFDVDESAYACMKRVTICHSRVFRDGFKAPFYIPPQIKKN
ncbi:unnamed protein product [Eruca vesicaria subsp. sativa]|uniref:KIB1-4 beta-propeller domain-containing protein n=1 Tax=Eruca vesicaria subsp. sativa TaxID=29727 RepID=A0ABC8M7B2_ERUVS|nr:unnamed protein product [Eruca vesicaria subsp. sativa]